VEGFSSTPWPQNACATTLVRAISTKINSNGRSGSSVSRHCLSTPTVAVEAALACREQRRLTFPERLYFLCVT
jgi:hypothetical protein